MDMLDHENIEKVIEGASDVNFEELHWLSPGIGWSPDASKLTFSAKAGDQDALYIYDIYTKDIVQHKFELDGLFSTAWSPKGDKIAFIGNFNGAGNLYTFNIETEEVEKIKARAKAQFVNGLTSNSGLAFQLAAYQTYWGDWREMFNELNRINAVTADDIRRVANTYLTAKNRTVIMMNTIES